MPTPNRPRLNRRFLAYTLNYLVLLYGLPLTTWMNFRHVVKKPAPFPYLEELGYAIMISLILISRSNAATAKLSRNPYIMPQLPAPKHLADLMQALSGLASIWALLGCMEMSMGRAINVYPLGGLFCNILPFSASFSLLTSFWPYRRVLRFDEVTVNGRTFEPGQEFTIWFFPLLVYDIKVEHNSTWTIEG